MALTNAQLREIFSAAGTPADNIEEAIKKVMNGHLASVNALREERDGYKTEAEKLPAVQKELDTLKAKGDPDWQKKYEDEHNDFEAYKTKIAEDKVKAQKVELYRGILKECNVDEKRIDGILKVSGEVIDGLVIKDGKLEDAEAVKTGVQSEWASFIMNETKLGAKVDTPPANNGGGEKKPESRAAQIAAEYHENLYGKTKGE